MKRFFSLVIAVIIIVAVCPTISESINKVGINKLDNLISATWQAEVSFPDWKGYIDDTLAMNSMFSFDGLKDQGKLYFTISDKVESFNLYVNNHKIDTTQMKSGIYEVDISSITKNGTNTVQVSNIIPYNIENAIIVNIMYPTVIGGTLEEVGLSRESFELISHIVEADIRNGFSSAQLAVIKDGKLVYQNAWGQINAYNQDGTRIENGIKVTNNTLYDLASNTKMYSVAYAIQYLVDN